MTAPSKRTEYARRYAKLHRNGYRLTVDSTVVVRIIKALQAIGYTREQIAERVGACDKRYVGAILNGRRPTQVPTPGGRHHRPTPCRGRP